MANMYSDHFNTGGSSGTGTAGVATLAGELTLDAQRRAPAGIGHARLRVKIARIQVGTAAGIGDVLRMMSFKSGDRIGSIQVHSDGGCTNGTAHLGLYLSGMNHDGAVLDYDLFGASMNLKTAADTDTVEEREAMFFAGALEEMDRWKPLWVNRAEGAGSDTVDPMLDYDLCFYVDEAVSVALVEVVVQVLYTSGD